MRHYPAGVPRQLAAMILDGIGELIGRYVADVYDSDDDAASMRDRDLLQQIIEPVLGDHLAAVVMPAEIEHAVDAVKYRWTLTVTASEKAALQDMFATC